MSSELPIACSLRADEMPARLAEMAAIGRSALLDVEHDATSATLRFRPSDRIRARLAGIVAAETECCGFLDLEVRQEADALVLVMSAPPDAKAVLDDLVAAFGRRHAV